MGLPAASFAAAGSNVMSAVGQIFSGQAQKSAADYNAQIQLKNAAQAKINAQLASQAGTSQVEAEGFKNRARVGAIKAEQGASGVTVGSGSFADVEQSQRELGQLDALTIRSNATKEAYGHLVESQGYTEKSALDKAEGENAETESYFAAGQSLLNGASDAATGWQKYKLAGGL